MNSLPVMDWNSKWDWENLVMFNSKTIESPRKQPTDWGIEEEGEIDTGSFNLYWGGDAGSSSDLAHGSSARSSISPSTDSSSKEGFHNFPGDFTKKIEFARAELAGTSPLPDSSVGSGEPLIGLKLGKRTYFENNCSGGSINASSVSMIPVASASTMTKKIKSCQSVPTPRCQVEGCNLDLSSAKEYHRKHKVCESHSKFSKVVVGGLERRFCQQCSRLHSLSEFDEKKRSCRKRLSDHNARRRKPQQTGIQFKSTSMPSPFLDGRQQMGFWLNDAPFVQTKSSSNPPWESTSSSKFTLTNGYQMKSEKTVGVHGHLQLPGTELLHAPDQNSNMPVRSKSTKPDVFTQGSKESTMLSFNSDAAQEHRALSLLSTDSWSSDPASILLDQQPAHLNLTPSMHGVPQGLPISLPEYWQSERSNDSRFMHAFSANDNAHFQELFRTPYENGLYNNLLN